METILKDTAATPSGFRVIQNNHLVQSINKGNRLFHQLDLSYIGEDIFYHGWIGYRSDEQIIEVLTGHFLELFAKHRCKKMLIDNRQMTGSFAALNSWLSETYMPQLISLGLEYNAVVYPDNVFSQLAVEDWDQKVVGFENRSFPSLDQALIWLRKV